MIEQPKRRKDLLVREVEEELLLYDPRTGEALLLNGTAAAIFELCDGYTPVLAIVEEILSLLPADRETVLADVQKIIGELAEKGLVEEGG